MHVDYSKPRTSTGSGPSWETVEKSGFVGSPEIYAHEHREPEQTVNVVTCHDGFTMNDLVSYDQKHNQANGECNRDGANDNRSWNRGVEGSTDDPEIELLRNRQVKNFLTVTTLSLGVPMILMGDEVRRTQGGKNNAYCQDNENELVRLEPAVAPCRRAAVHSAPDFTPADARAPPPAAPVWNSSCPPPEIDTLGVDGSTPRL